LQEFNDNFYKFFKKHIKPSAAGSYEVSERSLQLAAAALFIEMMRADAEITGDERRMVMNTIMTRFHLTEEESSAPLKFAEEKIRKATGYYEFTSLINKGFTYEQKVRVIENLWGIAFTDEYLDKHEEHMVRKIADLIYVEHKDFIDAKLRAKKKLGL
jgi:uncharacterized tellurite resistance protein B-like protein